MISCALANRFNSGVAVLGNQLISANDGSSASYIVGPDGFIYNQDGVSLEAWHVSGVKSLFEVMFTRNSGQFPDGGPLATWLTLGVSRSISLAPPESGMGVDSCNITVSIRFNGGAVLDTCTLTLTTSAAV